MGLTYIIMLLISLIVIGIIVTIAFKLIKKYVALKK